MMQQLSDLGHRVHWWSDSPKYGIILTLTTIDSYSMFVTLGEEFLARSLWQTFKLQSMLSSFPFDQRLCRCDSGEIETIEHMMFGCSWYNKIWDEYIRTSVKEISGQTDLDHCDRLLSDENRVFTGFVAKFWAACYRIWNVRLNMYNCF